MSCYLGFTNFITYLDHMLGLCSCCGLFQLSGGGWGWSVVTPHGALVHLCKKKIKRKRGEKKRGDRKKERVIILPKQVCKLYAERMSVMKCEDVKIRKI